MSFLGKLFLIVRVIDESFNLESASRWNTFLSIHSAFPQARREELALMLSYANPQPGEKIVEFSTGSGYLTIPLAYAVGRNDKNRSLDAGEVITYDVVAENSKYVTDLTNKSGLPITAKCFSFESSYTYRFEEEENSIAKVASLATFHHCDVRKTTYNDYDTSIRGRRSIFEEVSRILVPGGWLIIGDVAENTITQGYFDAIQEPRYCAPHGHPHSFLFRNLAEELCNHSNLSLVHYTVEKIWWHFKGEDEAVSFFQGLHNAQCPSEELALIMRKHLPHTKTKEGIAIGWELCFLTARK